MEFLSPLKWKQAFKSSTNQFFLLLLDLISTLWSHLEHTKKNYAYMRHFIYVKSSSPSSFSILLLSSQSTFCASFPPSIRRITVLSLHNSWNFYDKHDQNLTQSRKLYNMQMKMKHTRWNFEWVLCIISVFSLSPLQMSVSVFQTHDWVHTAEQKKTICTTTIRKWS